MRLDGHLGARGDTPPAVVWSAAVEAELRCDLGHAGDLTTDAILAPEARGEAVFRAREAGCVAGLPIALYAFTVLDPTAEFEVSVGDGGRVEPGDVMATVRCQGRALLSAERTALNYLGHLSGVASVTRRLVDAVRAAGATTDVVCTRKTTPGFRALEKYAVRCGGGANHRFGLDDAILIKDNHIALAGGIDEAVSRVRGRSGHMVKVEVEVDTLEQLDAVLELDVDVVLLDNMRGERLAEAVRRCKGRVVTEASGGINLDTGPIVAQAGVDLMSVGWLTHSAPCLDIGLDIDVT
ncbi:MAG: carboxylating nicotinate-nucleotide diphosphorylase [Acidobacteriota bacterium]